MVKLEWVLVSNIQKLMSSRIVTKIPRLGDLKI